MKKQFSIVIGILTLAFGALLAGGLMTGGCMIYSSTPTISGSGHVVTEPRLVSGFDRVRIGGSGHLTIQQGDEESLTITTDDNLLPYLKSSVGGGELRIGTDNVNLRPTHGIQYLLKLKRLRGVHLSGALEADADRLQTDDLAFSISGSGRIGIGRLEARNLDVQVSGSGDIRLAGKVEGQHIGISGSGDYHAENLESDRVEAGISGSGTLTVWAKSALNAGVSGSGEINYYGSPRVDAHTSGSGHVRNLGNK